jgi:4-hydroxy-tetrahydrodipicolinate synthase
MAPRFTGCYTAIITPFNSKFEVDWECLQLLTEFQIKQGVSGIVPAGTTGESPTLTWEEHNQVIEKVFETAGSRIETIAGTGSNSTEEALAATKHVADIGIKAALLVDPYYNGPSSLEIRREYYEPIASVIPEVHLIPYIIPGRTGTQLLPQDLAILANKFQNVSAVKEATGNIDNARQIRSFCRPNFSILSGDDDKTLAIMHDPTINANGVISVISNIVPKAVSNMVNAAVNKDWKQAERLGNSLQPLFSLVTVKVDEATPYGSVSVRARNPLPIKTMMHILGMQNGHCRKPLGRITASGLSIILGTLRKVWRDHPEILEPIGDFFDISIGNRLDQERNWDGLTYENY